MWFALIPEQTLVTPLKIRKWFLAVFRKIAKSGYYLRHVCISVCPSVRPHGTTPLSFEGFSWYSSIFRKSFYNFQVSLKSAKNNRHSEWRPLRIYNIISLYSSQNEKCFRQKLGTKSKYTFYIQKLFFRKSCRLCDNVERYCTAGQATDDNTTRRMRIACWIPKSTNTHSEYVIIITFPPQQWLHKCAWMLFYSACLLISETQLCLLRGTNWIFKYNSS